MTDVVKRFTPDQQSLWKVFSGATHGEGWLVSGMGGPIEEVFASILTPLLDIGDALTVPLAEPALTSPDVARPFDRELASFRRE